MELPRKQNLELWCFVLFGVLVPHVRAQSAVVAPTLSLPQAETIALLNHPGLASAEFRARASGKLVNEAKSAYYPTLAANMTGTFVADTGTAIAAGNLTTSSISNRFATGGALLQMVTDFGRTSALVQEARSQAKAQNDTALETREQVLLQVNRSYLAVVASEAVLRASREALANRQLTLRQVTALQQSQLKSTLDVSFAQVLESEAELTVYRAENTVRESRARLGLALGLRQSVNAKLVDELPISSLDPDVEAFVTLAEEQRPDLLSAISKQNAAHQFERAEKDLRYPTINVLAAAGEIPEHDHTLHDNYAAAGFNVNIPIFTGGLLKARREAASLEAQAEDKDVENLRDQIASEVREAWFEANNAFHQFDVTERLVEETRSAQHLAQARYDNGLGSIVELNEAQVNETSAEIEAASAKFDYLSRLAELNFSTGTLR
jgi:outer membrane protein